MEIDSDSPTPSASPRGHSGRKGSKKVRTGCITCKIRKVKCDEAKPFCMRCTKTGRKCDGYLDAKTMAQRRRRSGGLSSSGHGAAGVGGGAGDPHVSLTVAYEWASADEKRSFHFFQHVTAPCLSGDFDGVFWRVLVLQICQAAPAVKHAVLAVSSLHEGMVQGSIAPPYVDDTGDRQSFALCQYNKAIACLLDQMREVDAKPLVPLLTCVLFVCIELMQSKDRESLIHLEQGRQILSQLGRRTMTRNPEVDMIKQHLVPMYTKLSLTSSLLGGSPVEIPTPLKTMTEVPMVFESIDDVRYALYDFMDECLRFTKKSRPIKYGDVSADDMRAFEAEQDYLMRRHAKFNVAFSLYQSAKAKDAPPGSLALIQIHVHTIFIWVSTALTKNEEAFDSHVSTFSAIIPLAASFLDTLDDTAGGELTALSQLQIDARRFSTMFTFEINVIVPLYFVAAKCRHPLVRRTALDLLRRHPGRRENLWRANVMAAIAEHTMNLEEKHLRPARRPEGEHRAASPPELTAPYTYAFAPDDVWATGLPDVPLPDSFRMDVAEASGRPYGGYEPGTQGSCGHSMDMDMSSLDVGDFGLEHMPVDPTLLVDTTETTNSSVPHSFSSAASIASSFDDLAAGSTIFVAGGSSTPAPTSMGMADTASSSSATLWNPPYSQLSPPDIALEPPTPMGEEQGLGIFKMSLSQSSYSRPHSHSNSHRHSHSRQPSEGVSLGSSDESRHSSMTMDLPQPPPRSGDAPFDVPERFRVHDAIIGPDKEDGSWVMMFRKLGGLDADWDVQAEFVAVE